MNVELLPFEPLELAFIGVYLLSLIAVGWIANRARRNDSMADFYLGGKSIGMVVLVLTLYSTQYSGNTLFGYTGKAYRVGYPWVMCVHFMTAIVVFYLLLAPRLHILSRREGFITPGDYIDHRFRSTALSVTVTLVMVAAVANYLLAQMMAMGRAFEGLAPPGTPNAYVLGIVALALIIVIYETLGGFRAVVWTDTIQGLILMVGLAVLLVLAFRYLGTPAEATRRLVAAGPEGMKKLLPPDAVGCREWFSYILIVGLGGALYPQAIQRIYAARSAVTLRRSLAVMAFLPLTACLIAVFVGVLAAAYQPGLPDAESDKILTVVCRQIQQESIAGRWFVVVLFAAILAAIMSTADSVLLTVSSMLTKDFYARFVPGCLGRETTDKELAWVGKLCSWGLIGLAMVLAVRLRDSTLMQILDRKFDLLAQLSPAFLLGIHWKRLRAGPVLVGLLVGVLIAVVMAEAGYGKHEGIHAGLYGLAVNATIAIVGSLLLKRRVSKCSSGYSTESADCC